MLMIGYCSKSSSSSSLIDFSRCCASSRDVMYMMCVCVCTKELVCHFQCRGMKSQHHFQCRQDQREKRKKRPNVCVCVHHLKCSSVAAGVVGICLTLNGKEIIGNLFSDRRTQSSSLTRIRSGERVWNERMLAINGRTRKSEREQAGGRSDNSRKKNQTKQNETTHVHFIPKTALVNIDWQTKNSQAHGERENERQP